jgi:hypothetical protein
MKEVESLDHILDKLNRKTKVYKQQGQGTRASSQDSLTAKSTISLLQKKENRNYQ